MNPTRINPNTSVYWASTLKSFRQNKSTSITSPALKVHIMMTFRIAARRRWSFLTLQAPTRLLRDYSCSSMRFPVKGQNQPRRRSFRESKRNTLVLHAGRLQQLGINLKTQFTSMVWMGWIGNKKAKLRVAWRRSNRYRMHAQSAHHAQFKKEDLAP